MLSSASRVREYHDRDAARMAGCLPAVVGFVAVVQTKGYLEKNVEYFQPPYLFKTDGSGQPADRPVIDSARERRATGKNLITSAQAGSIAKVGLVRLGAPTHSEDQGQRYVPLSFSTSGTTITAASPATSNACRVLHAFRYRQRWRTLRSQDHSASAGRRQQPAAARSPITGIGGRCIDIQGGAAVNRADLWMNTCVSRQNWLYSTR